MVSGETSVLVVGAGSMHCALRITSVAEILRPLPARSLGGLPPFVAGLAILRGRPAPVVDLCRLLGTGESAPPTRFVALKVGERRVALAVTGVVGIWKLDPQSFLDAPPLVGRVSGESIEALGALDGRLLALLSAGRILTGEVWQALECLPPPPPRGGVAEPVAGEGS